MTSVDTLDQVSEILSHAEKKCVARGVRLTDKRKLVLSSLLQMNKAVSAYDIVDYCKKQLGEIVPAMSVYRILDFLQEQQLVHKLNLVNKYVACCEIACDHSHEVSQFLICSSCHKVKEIKLGKITEAELRRDVEEAGFKLVSPQLEINCLCEECVKASN